MDILEKIYIIAGSEISKEMRLKIGYILDERSPTIEDRAFINLAKKKNIELIFINAEKDLNKNLMLGKLKGCNIIFNNSGEYFSVEIAKTLESLGKTVIESSKDFYYEEDKWMFFLRCKKYKIPTPETILLSNNLITAKKEMRNFSSWPVVMKRVEGSNGKYVDLAKNMGEAESIIRKFWRKGSERLPIIAQEFIDSDYCYRATVIDGKIVQSVIKPGRGWKKTGNYSRRIRKFKPDKELKEIVEKTNRAFGMKIYGIDFLKKDGRWIVIEINAEPGLDFILGERRKLVRMILNYLKRETLNNYTASL